MFIRSLLRTVISPFEDELPITIHYIEGTNKEKLNIVYSGKYTLKITNEERTTRFFNFKSFFERQIKILTKHLEELEKNEDNLSSLYVYEIRRILTKAEERLQDFKEGKLDILERPIRTDPSKFFISAKV